MRTLVLAAKGGGCPSLSDLSALALGDLFRVFLAALVAGNAGAVARCAAVAQVREAPPDVLASFFASGLQFATATGQPTLFEVAAACFEATGCGQEARRKSLNALMALAAEKGDIPRMEWCRERGASAFNRAMAAAAGGGRLAAMEWCEAQGADAFDRARAAAAAKGRLAAIAWCGWSGAANFAECAGAIAKAAPGARLSFRASDHGAPATLRAAKGKDFRAALKWCLSAAGWGEAARAAGRTGRADVARWCFTHRVNTEPGAGIIEDLLKEILIGAAESGDAGAIVEWAAEILLSLGDRAIAQVSGALPGEGPLGGLLERALADGKNRRRAGPAWVGFAASEAPSP